MSEKTRGIFIVFEGIDGSGKSTQIELLKKALTERGRQVCVTAEPTDSVSGRLLREALSGASHRSPCELAALFLLDRIYHNVNDECGIEKLLNEGYDVVCDRYYYSSLAYQGSETDAAWVKSINLDCPEIRKPDVCIFLDLDPDTSLSRIGGRGGVTEIYEEKGKLERIRQKYFEVFESLGEGERVKIISAAASPEEVGRAVLAAVEELL